MLSSDRQKKGRIKMSHGKKWLMHLSFWSVLLLALTAEGWMDLICRAIYSL